MEHHITLNPEKKDTVKIYVHLGSNHSFDTVGVRVGENFTLYFPFEGSHWNQERMTFGQFADQMNIAIEEAFVTRKEKHEAKEAEEARAAETEEGEDD